MTGQIHDLAHKSLPKHARLTCAVSGSGRKQNPLTESPTSRAGHKRPQCIHFRTQYLDPSVPKLEHANVGPAQLVREAFDLRFDGKPWADDRGDASEPDARFQPRFLFLTPDSHSGNNITTANLTHNSADMSQGYRQVNRLGAAA